MSAFKKLRGFNTLVEFGDDGAVSVGRYFGDDLEEIRKAQRKMSKGAADIMRLFMPGDLKVSHSTKRVGDLEVDEYVFTFANLPEAQAKAFKAIYGGESLRMQIGVVGKSL